MHDENILMKSRGQSLFMSSREMIITPIVQAAIILLSLGGTRWIDAQCDAGFFASCLIFYGIFLTLTCSFLGGLVRFFPFKEGDFQTSSWEFYKWSLYTYLYTTHLYILYQNILIPSMFRAPFYRILGARIESGILALNAVVTDPPLLHIGKNVIIGEGCLIAGHLITQPGKFTLKRAILGDGVLIGARSVVLPGVVVGDHSVVRIGSIVYPNTVIPSYEMWGGNPAQKIKDLPH